MTLGWRIPTEEPTVTVLLRHGDTLLSPEHRLSGLTDVPLSADGTRQAKAAASRLATGARIDAVVSSPLRRAAATAAIAATELGLTAATDDDLSETSFGDWEGFTLAEVQARWLPGSMTRSRRHLGVRVSPTRPGASIKPASGFCVRTEVRQCWS